MPRPRASLVVLVALPGLLLAALGLLHPLLLTPDTAERWRLAHLLLLPVFPLVGGSLWLLLLGERGVLAWAARAAAFGYAVLYGALDSIAGIGAPHQVLRADERGERAPAIGDLYEIGDRLGHLGVVALAVGIALTAVVLLRRVRGPLVPLGTAAALGGCWLFYRHHVFLPRGMSGVLLVAGGMALMAAAPHREQRPPSQVPARFDA